MDRLLLKPVEVTEILGISRSRIYEMLATGELPSLRVGRCIRIPTDALKKWISTRQFENTKIEW